MISLGVIVFTLLSACDKGEGVKPEDKDRVDPVLEIKVTFENGTGAFTAKQTKPFGNNIVIDFPFYYPETSETPIDISRMKVDIKFDEKIEVLTTIPEVVDLKNPLTIKIINANGAEEDVVITGEIRKNSDAKILSFSLPGASVNGTIIETVYMTAVGLDREGKDLSNQIPVIEISAGATISPDLSTPQNFNNPVEYTVTAQDGTTQTYTVDDLSKINKFEINKGFNIASWLSAPLMYEGGPQRVGFFTEADMQLLAEHGFDHIRLCIDEAVMWDEQGNKIREYAFDLMHDAIQWGIKYNVRVIVDLHRTRNHSFTASENPLFTDPNEPAKFVKLWEDLSDELKDYPNSLVAYELLNEPVSQDSRNWNRVSELAINAIRAREADRTIIVGVAYTNGNNTYDILTIPSTHNILLTYHFYSPYLLTYYGYSSTTGGRTDIPIHYPGRLVPEEWISALPANWQSTGRNTYDKARFAELLDRGTAMARRLGAPVFVGEFGTWNITPEPARGNWYRDVVDILNEKGVPYTVFDYKGRGYSIINQDRSIRFPHLFNILKGQ